mmetsp:Transcript_3334/g.4821  ORF Transcript_3334/g.4821 Transcript_3334/m.4821 type:complete len:312 (+) Transcript_3334:127-1062(+)
MISHISHSYIHDFFPTSLLSSSCYMAAICNNSQKEKKTHLLNLILWQRRSPQTPLHHNNFTLAIFAFEFSLLVKSLHTQNITKINPILRLTRWTGSIRHEIIWKDKVIRNSLAKRPNHRGTKRRQQQRIDPTVKNFVPNSQPQEANNRKHGQIQQVIAELILLEGHGAHPTVNVALGLGIHRNRTPIFSQFIPQLIVVSIRHDRLAPNIGLHGLQIRNLLAIQIDHLGPIPRQILLERIELGVIHDLSSAHIIALQGIEEHALLLFDRETNGLSVLGVDEAIFLGGDAVFLFEAGFEEAGSVEGDFFAVGY